MNALDLRADHPKLLGEYAVTSSPGVGARVAAAYRHFVPKARLKPVSAR